MFLPFFAKKDTVSWSMKKGMIWISIILLQKGGTPVKRNDKHMVMAFLISVYDVIWTLYILNQH